MLNIGFPVYFQSKWDVQFIEQFPVRFYANKCKVVDNRLGKEQGSILSFQNILTLLKQTSKIPSNSFRLTYCEVHLGTIPLN